MNRLRVGAALGVGAGEVERAGALLALGRAAEVRPLLDEVNAAWPSVGNPDPELRAELSLLDAAARRALGQPVDLAADTALSGLRNPPRRLIELAERLSQSPP